MKLLTSTYRNLSITMILVLLVSFNAEWSTCIRSKAQTTNNKKLNVEDTSLFVVPPKKEKKIKREVFVKEDTFSDKKSNYEPTDVVKAKDRIQNAKTAFKRKGSTPYPGYITGYIDLKARMDITADEMNYIIKYWCDMNACSDTSWYMNNGQAFIDASKKTGLDPIFLLSLGANESGWNVSNLHRSKNNPYSINMTDVNPSGGYNMGSTFYDGIVNGGIWIHKNFYKKGYTSLYTMIYPGNYASAKDVWINHIAKTMERSYNALLQYRNNQ